MGCEPPLLQGINKQKRTQEKRKGTEDMTADLVLAKWWVTKMQQQAVI